MKNKSYAYIDLITYLIISIPNFSLILVENNICNNFEFPASVHTKTIGSFPISKYFLKISIYIYYILIKIIRKVKKKFFLPQKRKKAFFIIIKNIWKIFYKK